MPASHSVKGVLRPFENASLSGHGSPFRTGSIFIFISCTEHICMYTPYFRSTSLMSLYCAPIPLLIKPKPTSQYGQQCQARPRHAITLEVA